MAHRPFPVLLGDVKPLDDDTRDAARVLREAIPAKRRVTVGLALRAYVLVGERAGALLRILEEDEA